MLKEVGLAFDYLNCSIKAYRDHFEPPDGFAALSDFPFRVIDIACISMATNSLTVNVDPKYVEEFGNYGYKICVASGVTSGDKTHFNLLASANGRVLPHSMLGCQMFLNNCQIFSQLRPSHGQTSTAWPP